MAGMNVQKLSSRLLFFNFRDHNKIMPRHYRYGLNGRQLCNGNVITGNVETKITQKKRFMTANT